MIVDLAALSDLTTNGLMRLDPMPRAAETLAYLQTRPTYHGHVKGASVARHQPGNSTCWAPEDVLNAPHVFRRILALLPLAKEYLGREPLLYSVNAFTTYPIAGPMNPDIQMWHRDKDDSRFIALFVYLTDVLTPEDGAHLFQQGTQLGPNQGPVQTVLGPAGTCFMADTRGLHMGIRPTEKPRTMAWARWGVSDPPASYQWDKQQPFDRALLGSSYPTDPAVQASLRLVVR